MEAQHNTFSLRLFRSILLHATLLSCINLLSFAESATSLGNGTDRLALIAFKNGIFDPKSALSSWRDSLHFCKWDGVICSRQHPQRVTALNLGGQDLAGSLYPHVSNLSFLASIDLSSNNFQGQIPHEIGRLYRLRFLNLSSNSFDGEIPKNLTLRKELKALELNDNELDGKIPIELGSLRRLESLTLNRNNFIGSIPPSIGNLTSLTHLDLSINTLEGNIPDDLGRMVNLKVLVVRRNNLSGSLPFDTNKLRSLTLLNITNNKFSGNIPSSLGNCTHLEYLYMKGNFFKGSIPSSLSSLKSIQVLDLSHNNLFGQIPKYLEQLPLLHLLNLSSNSLEGEVPTLGIFRNTSAISLSGNRKLCGGILELQLPACPRLPTKKQGRAMVIGGVVVGFFLLLSSFLAIRFLLTKSTKKPASTSFMRNNFLGVTYAMLFKATDSFSSANLIGAGSHGSVYKGLLDCIETPVAIKILKLQQKRASKSFIA